MHAHTAGIASRSAFLDPSSCPCYDSTRTTDCWEPQYALQGTDEGPGTVEVTSHHGIFCRYTRGLHAGIGIQVTGDVLVEALRALMCSMLRIAGVKASTRFGMACRKLGTCCLYCGSTCQAIEFGDACRSCDRGIGNRLSDRLNLQGLRSAPLASGIPFELHPTQGKEGPNMRHDSFLQSLKKLTLFVGGHRFLTLGAK